jgi:hypothetical protein
MSEEAGKIALALIDAIAQMSDHAESLGGATSIAGVAALHKMQTSIQKNLPRITKALAEAQAIEARRAETTKIGSVEDESAVPEGNVP